MHSPNSLLLAGCGYLGRRIARSWKTTQGPVFALTRSREKLADLAQDGIEVIECDLTSRPPQLPSVNFQSIVWCIGYGQPSEQSRHEVWTRSVHNLLQSIRPFAFQRLVLVSTVGVYGDCGGAVVREDADCQPTTEGGRAMLAAEQLLRSTLSAENFQDRFSIGRFAGIYGPDRLLRRISDLQDGAPIPGDPDDWLNLIHVDDGAAIVNELLISPKAPSLINVVNRPQLTRGDYYRLLAELAGAPVPRFTGVPAGRPRSGNKRVDSLYLDAYRHVFQFDDLRSGLLNAIQMSSDQAAD